MKSFKQERLQKELLKLLNAIFNGEISDPRLSGIEITNIKVSKDQSQMKVYFTGHSEKIPLKEIIELLEKSSGFIKKQIAGASIMRTIPQISFHHDNSNQRIKNIDEIFKKLEAQKKNNNYYDDDNDNVYYDDDDELEDEDLDEYEEYNDDLEDELDFEYDDIDDDDDE